MTPNYSLRAITELEPGDHLCCLYETEEEYQALLTPFLRQGLERGEKIIYIVDTHTAEIVLSYLQNELEIEPYLASRQLSILTSDDVYVKNGIFDPDRIISLLETETERALADGYSALRVSGEMSWALRGLSGSERLIELESKVNTFFSGSKCLAICRYDRRRFDPAVLLNVLSTHPTAVVGTEVYDNFYYMPPTEFLKPDRSAATLRRWLQNLAARKQAEEPLRRVHDELEIRVQERTVELVKTSEILQAEITERKRAGESLRESEERYRDLVENNIALICTHDLEGKILSVNQSLVRQMGYERAEEILGHKISDFLAPDARHSFDSYLDTVVKEGHAHGLMKVLTRSGEERILEYHNSLRTEGLDKPIVRGVSHDVTERRRVEKALKEREKQYRNLFENVSTGIYRTTPDGRILMANPALIQMLGYSSFDELASHNLEKDGFEPTYPRSQFKELLEREGEVRGLEAAWIKRDGTIIFVRENTRAIRGEDGAVLYYEGTVEDITERKRAEEEHTQLLAQQRQFTSRLQKLAEASLTINSALSLDEMLQLITEQAREIIGAHQSVTSMTVDENWAQAINAVSLSDKYAAWREYNEKPDGSGIYSLVCRMNRSMRMTQAELEAHPAWRGFGKEAGKHPPMRGWLAAPLIGRDGQNLGLIQLSDKYEDEFTEEDEAILVQLGQMASVAIENTRLYYKAQEEVAERKRAEEAIRENLAQLSKKNRYETIISAVTRSVHQSINLQDVLENAVEAMSKNIDGAEHVSIYLVEGEEAVLRVYRGYPDWFIERVRRILYPKGFTWKAIIDKKPLYCPDVDQDTVIGPAGREVGTKSYLAMPIYFKEKTIGSINIHSFEKNAFDEEELKLLGIVARQIEVAINNAKQAEALRKSEEKFRNLVEHTSDLVWEIDKNGAFTYVNPKVYGIIGYEPGEVLGKTTFDFMPSDEAKRFAEVIGSFFSQQKPFTRLEKTIIHKDGHRIVLETSGSPVFDSQGVLQGYRGIGRNITERKRAEEALRESFVQLSKKNRYETIISTVTQSIHQSINLQDVLENAVEAMSKNIDGADNVSIYLVEGEEAVLKTYRGYPDWWFKRVGRIPYPKGFTWKAIIEGEPLYCADVDQDTVIGPAGREMGTKSYLSMPVHFGGKTVGVININSLKKNAFDEEELQLLEIVAQQIEIAINNAQQAEMLRRSEERYRILFDQSPVGVYIFDKDFKITHCNERMVEILQSSYDKIIGVDIRKLRNQCVLPLMEKVLEGESAAWEGLYEATNSLAKLWVSVRLSPLRDGAGKVIGGMAVVEDITERKRADEALHQAKEELELRVQERTQKLSEANEELRKEIAWRKQMGKALRDSEERYRALYEDNPSMYFTVDAQGKILSVNQFGVEQLGYTARELIGQPVLNVFYEDDKKAVLEQFTVCLQNPRQIARWESRKIRKDGSALWVREAARAVQGADGNPVVLIVCEDITERKWAEEALRKRTEQVVQHQMVLLELVKMDNSDLGSALKMITEEDSKTVGVERVSVWLFSDDRSEIICEDLYRLSEKFHEKGLRLRARDYPMYFQALEESRIIAANDARTDPRTSEYTEEYLRLLGITSMMDVPIRLHGRVVGIVCHEHTGPMREWTVEEQDFVASIADMVSLALEASERKRAEEQIKASLKEKEVLLKEIQHRVKNNLQVISSLLDLQSEYIKNKRALEMFNEAQNRVKSMALIHEQLYHSRDLARVDFAEYIRNLGAYLFQSYGVKSDVIKLRINVDDVLLGVDTATTCGLIINELVSNSLKHAFPKGRKGEIRINLRSDNDGRGGPTGRPYFTLIVSNNGVGFPKDLDLRNMESLGLQLVVALTDQLGGTIRLNRRHGTAFKVTFSPSPDLRSPSSFVEVERGSLDETQH